MNDLLAYSLGGILLVILELTYFRVADRFNIIDKPNQRSSHTVPTIRGGGIIFLFAVVLWFFASRFENAWIVLATLLIAGISFMDDIGEQPARIRLVVQLLTFIILGWQTGIVSQPFWIIAAMFVVGVGTLNAFNFMDGINGITGIYSLVSLVTLFVVNKYQIHFASEGLIIYTILGVVVFLYFNFRKKARCFAGDVGSVTIAFVLLYFLTALILATNNFSWILIFLVYGVDAVVTILYRLKKRENIFKAHRSHLYQYYSNELGKPHLLVSSVYGILQIVINILLVKGVGQSIGLSIVMALCTGIVYVFIRELILKKIGQKGFFSSKR